MNELDITTHISIQVTDDVVLEIGKIQSSYVLNWIVTEDNETTIDSYIAGTRVQLTAIINDLLFGHFIGGQLAEI